MKTIARLAAAAAVVVAAAPVGLGCQSSDRPRAAPAGPPAEHPVEPAPPQPPGPPAGSTAPASGAPAAAAPEAPVTKEYAGDIAKLCEVVQLAGPDVEQASDRRLPIATWLAANLTTTESRQFLARIQPLVGTRKADALDAEARRVGLAACSLSAEWRAQVERGEAP